MKYVALLSGGKDSCYNLLHCAKNGHELVAAATLSPEQGKEELDSYMYQTVGQDAIDLVARALDVPLHRQTINGTAINQSSEYGERSGKTVGAVEGDETEDLFTLLSTVKNNHPDVQGVSVGAILSNYQRVRVEHVCRRLGLTPLSYLWQRNQGELLAEMISAGMECVIIKVAGIGLGVKHLGKTLAQMQETLHKLNALYGLHICGEGGEYETLTIDCPLFKEKISLDQSEIVIHEDKGFATVAYLRIREACLVPKDSDISDIAVPSLLDAEFSAIANAAGTNQPLGDTPTSEEAQLQVTPPNFPLETRKFGSWVSIANVTCGLLRQAGDVSLEDEVKECFENLQNELSRHSLNLSNCANINIFISSMEHFARINAVYSTFFGTSPPARACVAVDLPNPIRVRLDCTAFVESQTGDRQALHVQGLSYWAPANIGPYSQAIIAGEQIFISGQIGLIPSSLTLPHPRSFSTETALSFQHVNRVASAVRENAGNVWEGLYQSAIYWLNHLGNLEPARRAHMPWLPGADVPTIFLVVKELPKGALIEKQVQMHTGRCKIVDDDGESTFKNTTAKFDKGAVQGPEKKGSFSWQVSQVDMSTSACVMLFVQGHVDGAACASLKSKLENVLSVRLFYRPQYITQAFTLFQELYPTSPPPITPVPCRVVASTDAVWDFAFCFTAL